MMNDQNQEKDLRPVIARLKEIERKCASMGSRNEDFPAMQEKLARIISQLESHDSEDEVSYRALARELFPVAHLFESLGFMSVGKEISHIEKALTEMDPDAPAPTNSVHPKTPGQVTTSSAAAEKTAISEESSSDQDPAVEENKIPRPIIFAFLLLIAAIFVAAAIVLRLGPFAAKTAPPPQPTVATVTAAANPAPTNVPSPTPPPAPRSGNTAAARLAEEISQARLALARGDLEGAIPHLSSAALIDRNNVNVAELAKRIVDGQIGRSDYAAGEARFTDAEASLDRARRLAMRFNLDTEPIDEAAARHAAMVRFSMIEPGDRGGIRAASGRRTLLTLNNGTTREGRIKGVAGSALSLEVNDDVGGGVVRYIDDIPLSSIRSIKVFED